MRSLTCGFVLFLVSMAAASPAGAAPLTFTSRTAWESAIGGTGDLFEDFNSYTGDVLYGTPLTAGFLTLSVVNGTSDDSWRIDAGPAQFASLPSVNGTSFATTLALAANTGYGGTSMSFAPVIALAFDYAGSSYSTSSATLTTSLGHSLTLAALPPGQRGFFGILYTGGPAFTSLTWTSAGSFGAGIDNVTGLTPAPVPEPAGIALTGSGLVVLALVLLRRRRIRGMGAA